jgi:uncharacterized Zn finger protein
MTAPSALVLACETCGEVTHRVLKGRLTVATGTVFEGTVKCTGCGRIRKVVVRESTPVDVPLVVSWREESTRTTVPLGPDEVLSVGDRLDLPDGSVKVTSLEVADRRVERAQAKDVTTIWAVRFDRVRIKVSVNMGPRTVAREIEAAPDEEFYVGDLVDVGPRQAVIHRIRTATRTLRRGGTRAEDIVRIYGRVVRERRSR